MDALRRLCLGHRRSFLALVVMALAIRALVPAGWMVMPDAGGVRLMPCSGSGPVELAPAPGHATRIAAGMAGMAGMGHHDDGETPPAHADHPCAFAGIGLASDLPAIALTEPPAAAVDRDRPGIALAVAIGHGLAAPPPPQTGPPAFA